MSSGPAMQPRILLADGITTAIAGPSIGIQGDYNLIGNIKGYNLDPALPVQIWVTNRAPSSTATVIIETAATSAFSGAVTWWQVSFASIATIKTWNQVGVLRNKYVRARVSAISGAIIDVVMRVG